MTGGGAAGRRYFRRRWDEARGDDHVSWNGAVYFFETDLMLMAVRQVEEYDDGCRFLYGLGHSGELPISSID